MDPNFAPFIVLAISSLFSGITCAMIAHKQGRNVFFAFFAGMFLGLFAMVYYTAAGKTLMKQYQDKLQIEEIDRVARKELSQIYRPTSKSTKSTAKKKKK